MAPKMHEKHGFSVWAGEGPETRELKRALLVVNPKSGGKKGLKILARVQPILEKAGVKLTVVHTEYAGHAREIARTHDLSEIDAFCPIGGDGTVHEVVNGFMRRDDYDEVHERVTIAIIPGGTGNTLAYDMSLSTAERAAELLVAGSTRLIDVGKVQASDAPTEVAAPADGAAEEDDGEDTAKAKKASKAANGPDDHLVYSINLIGYGLTTTVMKVANSMRFIGGAQYKLAAYHSMLRNRGYRCTVDFVDAEGKDQKLEGKFLMIHGQMTVHMGERTPFAPDAQLDDGLFELVLIKHGHTLKMINTLKASEKNKHRDKPTVIMHKVRSFTVTPHESVKLVGPTTVNVDGELAGSAPFRADIVPKALRVVAP